MEDSPAKFAHFVYTLYLYHARKVTIFELKLPRKYRIRVPHEGYKSATSRLQKFHIKVTKVPHQGYKSSISRLQKLRMKVTKAPYQGYKSSTSRLQKLRQGYKSYA